MIIRDPGEFDQRISFCCCLACDALTGAVLDGEFFCCRDLAVNMNDPGGNSVSCCSGSIDRGYRLYSIRLSPEGACFPV